MRGPIVSRGWRGWGLVGVSVVVAGGSAGLSAGWLPGAWAALVGAVGASIGGVWSTRGLARRDLAVAASAQVPQLLTVDRRGRLPLVAHYQDPLALGVHRAASGGTIPEGLPVFVPRDISADLQAALVPGQFVLLVGESTAGKTRAAYEAISTCLGQWPLIEPAGRSALPVTIQTARQMRRSAVIWLDDLERFLGSGGLSRTDVQTLLHGCRKPHCIVATMRSEEHARFLRAQYHGPDRLSTDAQRQGEEVLRLAHEIRLPRAWSPAETARAANASDPRIREALQHVARFGVAEYLAAGPKLLRDWQDAWAAGAHPRGAALVAAGVLARRSGIHRPLPAAVLAQIAQPLLDERGGHLLRPEPVTEALAWATAPLHATSSLLLPAVGGYGAFDYLIDALPKQPPPAAALAVLVDFATVDEAIDLADLAWGWYRFDQAQAALGRALNHPVLERRSDALSTLSHIHRTRLGEQAAFTFTADTVREHTARLGADHPDTLEARALLAWYTRDSVDRPEAIRLMTEVLAVHQAAGRGDLLEALKCRRAIIAFRAESGEHEWAAGAGAQLVRDWEALSGPQDQWVIGCRISQAMNLYHAGHVDQGIALLGDMLADPNLTPGSQQQEMLRSQLAYALREAGDYAQAEPLFRARAQELNERYGPSHDTTLSMRVEVAACVGHLGDAQGAVRILQDVVAARDQVNEEVDLSAVHFRRCLAMWIGLAGDPLQAARRLEELTALSARMLGDRDFATLACRSRSAHWKAVTGAPEQATRELTATLAHMERLWPHHAETQACRNSLQHWRTATVALTPPPPTP
jgi:tetratricopeptide (TPR) repeat protein